MIVEARQLRLTNIDQLIAVVIKGTTLMGKLERVKFHPSGLTNSNFQAEVTLRIGGDTITVPAQHHVNIRRSGELYELHQAALGMDELLESAGVGA